MTAHGRLMLKRHLESAIRTYAEIARQLREDNHESIAKLYDEYADDAQEIIDKINVGIVHVIR